MDNMIVLPKDLQSLSAKHWPRWAPLLDRALLAKPSDLQPQELHYLRHRAGWTEADVARVLGVSSNVTVARWESGTRRMPRPTERLFRLLLASVLGACSLRSLVEHFKSSWRLADSPLEIHLYLEKNHYEYRWAAPPKKLPPAMRRLFWDVDPLKLDLQPQADYIILRVLEKGDLGDWNWLRWTYGETRIATALKQKRGLAPATAHLWRDGLLAQPGGRS